MLGCQWKGLNTDLDMTLPYMLSKKKRVIYSHYLLTQIM